MILLPAVVYPSGIPRFRKARHIAEYAALRVGARLVQAMPYRLALALAWGVAAFAFHVVRFRRRETARRIREVLGAGLSDHEVARVAWASLRNLCFTSVDIVRTPRLTRRWIARHVSGFDAAHDTVRAVTAGGKGAILATPHMGSWEMAGAGGIRYGLPIFSIAGKQRNPYFDAWLQSARERAGYEILTRGATALRGILRRLQAGGIFAVLPDLRMHTDAVPVRFLGVDANIGAGMALFARQADVPILPCVHYRDSWTRHRLVVHPPVTPDPALDKEADVRRMTQAVMSVFDTAIRADPGQWFWYNRRWVLEPVDKPAGA